MFLWILAGFLRLGEFQYGVEEFDGHPRQKDYSKDEFIEAAIRSAVEDEFDYGYIREMCDDQEWDSSLVFSCNGAIGGIGTTHPYRDNILYSSEAGNIKQQILLCIRYAIDAGAGLMLPTISLRSEDNLSELESGTASLDYLFDQDRFLFRLHNACPRMTVYKDLDELRAVGPVTQTELIDPTALPHGMTSRIAYSAKDRIKEIRAPADKISLIPFERVWKHL